MKIEITFLKDILEFLFLEEKHQDIRTNRRDTSEIIHLKSYD